jgi:hypothetical protein
MRIRVFSQWNFFILIVIWYLVNPCAKPMRLHYMFCWYNERCLGKLIDTIFSFCKFKESVLFGLGKENHFWGEVFLCLHILCLIYMYVWLLYMWLKSISFGYSVISILSVMVFVCVLVYLESRVAHSRSQLICIDMRTITNTTYIGPWPFLPLWGLVFFNN